MASTAAAIRRRMMRLKTLHVRDNRVIDLQLLQSARLPFFGIFIINPVLHSFGVDSFFHMLWKIFLWSYGVTCSSGFDISGQIPSAPGAFPFFSFFIASFTSAIVMSPVLMSRLVSASRISASPSGLACLKLSQNVLSTYLTLPFLQRCLFHQMLYLVCLH